MIRNWEVIRAILVKLENAPTPTAAVKMSSFDEFDDKQEVAYNMRLLEYAGCIKGDILEAPPEIAAAIATQMTSKGHDLLDTIRRESVWEKIKKKFESKGLDMTIDLVMSEGKKIIENALT